MHPVWIFKWLQVRVYKKRRRSYASALFGHFISGAVCTPMKLYYKTEFNLRNTCFNANSIFSHLYPPLQTPTTSTTQELGLAILSVSVAHFQGSAVHCNLDKCTLIQHTWMAMTAYYRKTYYAFLCRPPAHPLLWLSLLFFVSSLLVGSDFILLSLSVPLSLSSLSLASQIFQWLESNLLRERRWHGANANSVFLSESCWVCVSKRYENIYQETCSKSTGLCRLVFGRNNCTLHPNSRLVKQEEEERKREGAEQGERDKEGDQEWR